MSSFFPSSQKIWCVRLQCESTFGLFFHFRTYQKLFSIIHSSGTIFHSWLHTDLLGETRRMSLQIKFLLWAVCQFFVGSHHKNILHLFRISQFQNCFYVWGSLIHRLLEGAVTWLRVGHWGNGAEQGRSLSPSFPYAFLYFLVSLMGHVRNTSFPISSLSPTWS